MSDNRVIKIPEKEELHIFLKDNIRQQLYLFSGMNEDAEEHSEWKAMYENGDIKEVVLISRSSEPPHLYFLGMADDETSKEFYHGILDTFSGEFYKYVSAAFTDTYEGIETLEDHGNYFQMHLVNKESLQEFENIRLLVANDLGQMQEIYDADYPGNWFMPSMLENGMYMGYFDDDILCSLIGTNLLDETHGVASLGNMVTRAAYRKQGIGKKLMAALCFNLVEKNISEIGLSVHTGNTGAISIYEQLGFAIVDEYVYRKVRK